MERDAHLVGLVRELYDLAAAERVPGVIAHDTRSKVFRRCAVIYEALGEDAFSEPMQPATPSHEPPIRAQAERDQLLSVPAE